VALANTAPGRFGLKEAVFRRFPLALANAGRSLILSPFVAKIFKLRRVSTLALRQRKAALLRKLSVPSNLLRGSFVQRFTTCGKPNCCCARGQRHGPFYYLVSNLASGHVLKFLLKDPLQQAAAHQAVQHYQGHWERLEELSQINAELLRRGELSSRPPG
jgi:hypothetical protein